MHLDNDSAGRLATMALKTILPKQYEVIDDPPKIGKDFNDFLCSEKGINYKKIMKERDKIMKYNYLELAETLKEKRKEKGISTRNLGEKVGVSHTEISRIENGMRPHFSFVILSKYVRN